MVRWLVAFLFTQLVECPIYLRALEERGGSTWRRLAIALGASSLTHPIVWFVIPWIWDALDRAGGYWSMVVAAEAFAVGAEAAYLWAFGLRRALPWALAANVASVTLGLLSRGLFGWP